MRKSCTPPRARNVRHTRIINCPKPCILLLKNLHAKRNRKIKQVYVLLMISGSNRSNLVKDVDSLSSLGLGGKHGGNCFQAEVFQSCHCLRMLSIVSFCTYACAYKHFSDRYRFRLLYSTCQVHIF